MIKKYIGATGDALVYAWGRFRGVNDEDRVVSPTPAPGDTKPIGAIGGISVGTLMLAGLAYMFLKR